MTAAAAAPHRLIVRVYYEDTDFSGVVYHANYLKFLERGRTEFLRRCGISQSVLRGGDGNTAAAFAVRQMNIDFAAPARMDELLTVETALERIGGASIAMAQAILRDNVLLVSATVKIALVQSGRARRLPPELTRQFRTLDLAEPSAAVRPIP